MILLPGCAFKKHLHIKYKDHKSIPILSRNILENPGGKEEKTNLTPYFPER